MEAEGAVTVRGAYKRYSHNTVVLRGLDLTVADATIYGLLGPSGCGKTTLLRSLVGMVRLDSGEIHVKARQRNNVGYMPQELGLYDYMSIMEAFHFYGKLYGMEQQEVKSRGRELADFLELPDSKRLIGTLSGGQQRRLSFAVTLLHDPDLLILDEPTVGIDPILSAAIWERLLEMATCQRKTIIITTHYIEEAKQAHMIGLMRDGVLLAEQSPTSLMISQGCESLEEAFLVLSKRQETSRSDDSQSIESDFPATQNKPKPPLVDPCPYWKTNRFMAQLTKNTRWLVRNLHATLFFLLLPASIAITCELVLSHNPGAHRTIGIVSPELIDGLETCTSQQYEGCGSYDRPFTCRFMDYLTNSSIETRIYDTLDEGKAATRKNEVWGVLEFNKNYTDAALDRIYYTLFTTPPDVVESSFINAYMDMSNMWVSTFLRRELLLDVRMMIQGFLKDCDVNPHLLDIPVQFRPAIFGTNNPTYLQFFIPGVICTFAFYLSIMYTTAAIMFEKSVGLERSLVAGMSKIEVVVAHSVVQIVIAIVQEVTILVILYYWFDNPCIGNMHLIMILLIMLQIMGLFYGLVLGLLFTSQRDATNAGIGTVNALFMLAGLVWPVEGMHYILRNVLWAIPVQPAVEAYRAIAMRDWHLSHPVVYKGFLSTSVWTAIFVLGTIVLARSNKTSL
uniref:Uncharacterized protein n=1 Tax=Graphocephala atropunctata TaxID=36148 RepID=A0A1B6LK41_9HEMI